MPTGLHGVRRQCRLVAQAEKETAHAALCNHQCQRLDRLFVKCAAPSRHASLRRAVGNGSAELIDRIAAAKIPPDQCNPLRCSFESLAVANRAVLGIDRAAGLGRVSGRDD